MDQRIREEVFPKKIYKTEGVVENAEFLLNPEDFQIGLNESRLVRVAGKASVILDFGQEMNASVRILTHSVRGGGCKVRIRTGESVSECCAEIGDRMAGNHHTLRDAEVLLVMLSDMLVSGYGGYATVQDYYDVYGSDQSAAWDFSSFAADVIILDLGTNDSFIGAPADFILEKYVSFLAHLREKNPNGFIFCCAGAMVTSVNGVVAEAVAQRNSDGDENVWFYALPTITKGGHPHEEEHMFNGYSLSAFIRQTLGWIAEI